MIITQVSYASNNYGTLSTLNIQSNLIPNHLSVTTVEGNSDFLVKKHVLWFPMGFLDAGYPHFRCRSGNSPNYIQLAGSYRVEKSE